MRRIILARVLIKGNIFKIFKVFTVTLHPAEFPIEQLHRLTQFGPQLFSGHGWLQAGPKYPGLHSQNPNMRLHCPLKHRLGHRRSQFTPNQPALQRTSNILLQKLSTSYISGVTLFWISPTEDHESRDKILTKEHGTTKADIELEFRFQCSKRLYCFYVFIVSPWRVFKPSSQWCSEGARGSRPGPRWLGDAKGHPKCI